MREAHRSFRDPAGFVFMRDGTLLRQVNPSGLRDLELLHGSGLYEELAGDDLLVRHERVGCDSALTAEAAAVLRPERVPFVSYPSEWGFGQLQDAALLTLELQRRALRRGMWLKDASALNVQFVGAQPVFVDTLSFSGYVSGAPWPAYRQFCEHFLVPLALASAGDARLLRLHDAFADGVPLGLGTRILRGTSWLRPGLLLHIHLHARAVSRASELSSRPATAVAAAGARVSRRGLEGTIAHLDATIRSLRRPEGGRWDSYSAGHRYSAEAMAAKQRIVGEMLDHTSARNVLDLGANTGEFSTIAAARARYVIAVDADHGAGERLYQSRRGSRSVLPLVVDLLAPTAAVGWGNRERQSFTERAQADIVLALALVHHLVIDGHVPLEAVASYLADRAPHAIVELVPHDDEQVRELLAHRPRTGGVHPLHRDAFIHAFGRHFRLLRVERLPGSGRELHFLSRIRSPVSREAEPA